MPLRFAPCFYWLMALDGNTSSQHDKVGLSDPISRVVPMIVTVIPPGFQSKSPAQSLGNLGRLGLQPGVAALKGLKKYSVHGMHPIFD